MRDKENAREEAIKRRQRESGPKMAPIGSESSCAYVFPGYEIGPRGGQAGRCTNYAGFGPCGRYCEAHGKIVASLPTVDAQPVEDEAVKLLREACDWLGLPGNGVEEAALLVRIRAYLAGRE